MAAAIGVSEAIVIHRLDYWLDRTKHHFAGRAWVYNTYESWQAQFPFWSRRTIQATFRRLERLGIIESSQKHNRSRWDKTKWYTIDYARLSELVPQIPAAEAPANEEPMPMPSMATDAIIDEANIHTIDDAETSSSWITKDSSIQPADKISSRACVREPEAEARTPALETPNPAVSSCHREITGSSSLAHAMAAPMHPSLPTTTVASAGEEAGWEDVDVAFGLIPQAEQPSWLERAQQALREQGTPWLETCLPVVKALAFKLWGLGIPVYPEAVRSSP